MGGGILNGGVLHGGGSSGEGVFIIKDVFRGFFLYSTPTIPFHRHSDYFFINIGDAIPKFFVRYIYDKTASDDVKK